MKLWLFSCILLFVIAAGCITSEVPAGAPGQYELPGIPNTTIYYLNGTIVKVVDSVINETTVRYMMDDSSGANFKDPIAVDFSGMNVSFNVTSEPIFGRSYIRFDFGSTFSGYVAFTQSDGKDFIRTPVENKSVRVILPQGYTTGSRFLGIPNPEPDNITVDTLGRQVLIWDDPYPFQISVKYYDKGAPMLLYYFSIILAASFVVVCLYYYITIRPLKKKRNQMEKSFKK